VHALGRANVSVSDVSVSNARALALRALERIDGGAYANLVVPALLGQSHLGRPDRNLVTELVYGTTRMQRACDWLVDRFLVKPPDAAARAALRLGAYQLAFMRVPAHAAVSQTVAAAPSRARPLVNAVLRRVAAGGNPAEAEWPSEGVRLSYPDWIVDALTTDLGRERAVAALTAMNNPGVVTVRDDGYVQDRASQWVADALGAGPGHTVLDLCAAPGGKATALARGPAAGPKATALARGPAAGGGATAVARGPALVAAMDIRPGRVALVAENAQRLGARNVAALVGDATNPPFRPGRAERVLVDAPCSGLGVLHRRPDARWRVTPKDVLALAALQRRILGPAAALVAPGGLLAYSVCTLTAAETTDVDEWLAGAHPELRPVGPPPPPWEPAGRGARLLPGDTDGMFLLVLRRS
jgi:16S rRNA (cytosine967-C5)-methyltransferase